MLAALAAGVVWLATVLPAVAVNFSIVTTNRPGDGSHWKLDGNQWYANARVFRRNDSVGVTANGRIYSISPFDITPGTRIGFSAANLNWRVDKIEKGDNAVIDAKVYVSEVAAGRGGGMTVEVPVVPVLAVLAVLALGGGIAWLLSRSRPPAEKAQSAAGGHVDWRPFFISPVAVDPPGGFGTIYNVHPRWHPFRKLKLKILMAKWASDSLWINQMRVECATLRYLGEQRYPHAPQLVDYGGLLLEPGQGSEAWFVMTIAAGNSLDKTIRRTGRRSLQERLTLVMALSRALASLHQLGVVHRDLTPENVFVDRKGPGVGGWRIEFIDFGSAKAPSHSIQFPPGYFIGKVQYSAPEHRADMNQADKPADVYALGVMACEILLGRLPFQEGQPEKPEQLVDQLNVEGNIGASLAKYIVWRLLNKNPAQRGSAQDFAEKIAKSHPEIV